MVNRNHPAFKKGAEPFYNIIMKGLKGEVDGEHFWDAVAEDAVFEFLYHFPGFLFWNMRFMALPQLKSHITIGFVPSSPSKTGK